MNRLVESFRSLLQGAAPAEPKRSGDGDLLRRYAQDGDAAAFTQLVARHTPLVYRVCRGVLADRHDAEDATQAVFLALSQHARSIRRQESVASWLHGVALHTARSYRRRLGRGRARDAAHAMPEASAGPDAFDELTVREARELLHAELDRLPERYKAPLVLIYFEELSHDQAARALGWSPGRFRGRLERARAMLGQRLLAHKLTFGGALAMAGLAIAVPQTLAAEVATAALGVGVAGTAGGALSPAVVEVAAEVGRSVALAKAPSLAAGLVAAAVVGTVGTVALSPPAERPDPQLPAPTSLVATQPPWGYHVGHVVTTTGEGFYVLNPDGGNPAAISAPVTGGTVTRFRGSPTALAYETAAPGRRTLHLWRYADAFPGVPIGDDAGDFFWCQATRRLVVTLPAGAFLLDPITLARQPLAVPAGLRPIDATSAGDALLCVRPAANGRAGLCLYALGTGRTTAVGDDLPADLAPRWRLSPDQSRVAGMTRTPEGTPVPAVVEVATGQRTTLAVGDVDEFLAWSPDSLAVLLARRRPGGDLDAIVARRLAAAGPAPPLNTLTVTRFEPGGGVVTFRPRAADWQR